MFIKITRINSQREPKETIINTDMIIGVSEEKAEVEELFNAEGELVSSTPKPTTYLVLCKGGIKYRLDKENYDTLTSSLLK